MTLDDVTVAWRSQDLSPLYDVDKTLLHQVLRQEHARIEKRRRSTRRFMYVVNTCVLLTAALFFAILIDPHQPLMFSARVSVWDYVVAAVGVAAALAVAGAMSALRQSRQERETGFGDSLRDQLRRRIAQLDADATSERRLILIVGAATLIGGKAMSILAGRIQHVPMPWSDIVWPSRFATVLMLGFLYLLLFRWIPRERQNGVARKRQLEALLAEFDVQ